MAVPSSGTLSLRKLANEKIDDDYNSAGTPTSVSLANLATGTGYDATNTVQPFFPNGTTPHEMSEWYRYDHDYLLTSFTMSGTSTPTEGSACALSPTSTTVWHDGVSADPANGDVLYSTAAGGAFDGNNEWWKLNSNIRIFVSISGVVSSKTAC